MSCGAQSTDVIISTENNLVALVIIDKTGLIKWKI